MSNISRKRKQPVVSEDDGDGATLYDDFNSKIQIQNDDEVEDDVNEDEEEEEEGDDDSAEIGEDEDEAGTEGLQSAELDGDDDDDDDGEYVPHPHAGINYADASDSSEDESVINTVGNIPMKWYDDFEHVGYDRDGNRISKSAKGDTIDNFLKKEDDPNYWRTVYDQLNDKNVVLTDEQLDLINNLQKRRYPAGFDPYPEAMEFPHESEYAMRPDQPSKRSFLRRRGINHFDISQVYKLAQKIRDGYIKPKAPKPPQYYDLWADKPKEEVNEWLPEYLQPKTSVYRPRGRIIAPKVKAPGHNESYNPPKEYLFNKEEEKEWLSSDRRDRHQNFMPTQYKRYRDIRQWQGIMRQSFDRCMDLYLAPRRRKPRMVKEWDYTKYLPELPKPKDLRPFPTEEAMKYEGHTDRVRSITISPSGEFLASCGDDHSVRLWEVSSGRCMGQWDLGEIVYCVSWNPNPTFSIIAACSDDKVYLLSPDTYILSEPKEQVKILLNANVELINDPSWGITWQYGTKEQAAKGIHIILLNSSGKATKHVAWHIKGDYFSTTTPDAASKSVHIHQLSKRNTQAPFKKTIGIIGCTSFHPSKPYFFIATQTTVRIYNLAEQIMVKKLQPNLKWISNIDVHPLGDNVLISSYDKRVAWVDLDLSTKAYKTLRYHKLASRRAVYHKRYPIFATCSDDANIHVFHGMVYDDLMKNALIVPLKVLKGHSSFDDLGVLDIIWHPEQPWIFSAGADNSIRLWT